MVTEKFLTREYGAGETITTPAIPFPYLDTDVFNFINWDLPQDNKMPELERGEELEVNAHFTTKLFMATVKYAPWLDSSEISFDKHYAIYGDEDITVYKDKQYFKSGDVQYDILEDQNSWIDVSNNIGHLGNWSVSGRRYRYDTSTSSYKNYVETEADLLPADGANSDYDAYHDRCLGNVTIWRGSTYTIPTVDIILENYVGQGYDAQLKFESFLSGGSYYPTVINQSGDSSIFTPGAYLYNCYELENYYGDRPLQTKTITVPKSIQEFRENHASPVHPARVPQYIDTIVNGEIRRTYTNWCFPEVQYYHPYIPTYWPDAASCANGRKLIVTVKDQNGTILYKNYEDQRPDRVGEGWVTVSKYITEQTTSITIRSVYIWNLGNPYHTDRTSYLDYDQTTRLWIKDGPFDDNHPDYPSSLLNGKRFVRWERGGSGRASGEFGEYYYRDFYAILEEL